MKHLGKHRFECYKCGEKKELPNWEIHQYPIRVVEGHKTLSDFGLHNFVKEVYRDVPTLVKGQLMGHIPFDAKTIEPFDDIEIETAVTQTRALLDQGKTVTVLLIVPSKNMDGHHYCTTFYIAPGEDVNRIRNNLCHVLK